MSVVLLAALDEVARESAALALLLDLPAVAVVGYDLRVGADGRGELRRVVTDATGRLLDDRTPLGHACLSCSVREGIVPTLQLLLGQDRWRTLAVALPLTAGPGPVAYAVQQAIDAGELPGAVLSSVVSLVEEPTLVHDLLGDDLLAERGLSLGETDRRSVGEAVAAQVEYADVVVTLTDGDAPARTLLEHLVPPTTQLRRGWAQVAAADLVNLRHDLDQARRRVNPLAVRPTGAPDRDGVWTLDLRSSRPFHPERLTARLEDLGGGRLRGRGHFWLPTRPGALCAWDGAGGQVSIGTVGAWGEHRPRTRLVVTGIDPDDRTRVAAAYADVLLTRAEAATQSRWLGADDGLDAWLGAREDVA